MTRIAYLASEYPAPSHTFIRREIAALRREGIDIVPFSIRPVTGQATSDMDRASRDETQAVLGRSPLDYLAATGAAIFSAPLRALDTLRVARRHRAPGIKALTWSIFHCVEAFLLARLLKRVGATHLHSHFANSGATVGMLAAHYTALPWSLTLHGVSETDYPAGLVLADKIARAEFVACASWFMQAQAMRVAAPEHWGKLQVVRCGVDIAALPPAEAGSEGTIRFICVGRLSPEKGHRGLFDAFGSVLAREPDARLILVGDGPLKAELTALAEAQGIARAVSFRGALNETATLAAIGAADILVLPSLMEGLPVVIMEAMALGKPVISSGVAGIPELVRDGANGLLFPPSRWQELGEKMVMLATDKNLRDRLGQAGKLAVAEEFAIDRAIRPLIPLFSRGND